MFLEPASSLYARSIGARFRCRPFADACRCDREHFPVMQRSVSMKSSNTCLTIAALSLMVSAGALAAGNPHGMASSTQTHQASPHAGSQTTAHTTGQPNQSCGSATAPNTPGNSASAPGSAFNPDGKAGTVYAGEQPQNSRNPKSVSQYDAACAHQR